jgi:exosortase K
VGLTAAAALKIHYRNADSDALLWILRPTAWLVEMLLGVSLEYETGAGYWERSMGVLIAPGCAGINFFCIAFASVIFPCAGAFPRFILKLSALSAAAGGAYLTTLWANTIRIAIAARLHVWGLSLGWMTPERIHRLEGVLIFLVALWLFSDTVRRCLARASTTGSSNPRHRVLSSPVKAMAWYVLGIVVVPLVNPLRPGIDAAFFEHCLTVVGGCVLVATAAGSAASILRYRRGTLPCNSRPRPGEGKHP